MLSPGMIITGRQFSSHNGFKNVFKGSYFTQHMDIIIYDIYIYMFFLEVIISSNWVELKYLIALQYLDLMTM